MNIQSMVLMGMVMAILTSCSVEKRRYMSGYHVEWNNRNNIPKIEESDSSSGAAVLSRADAQKSDIRLASYDMENDSFNSNEPFPPIGEQDQRGTKAGSFDSTKKMSANTDQAAHSKETIPKEHVKALNSIRSDTTIVKELKAADLSLGLGKLSVVTTPFVFLILVPATWVWALAFGVLALGILSALLAIILGKIALRKIEKSNGQLGGEEKAKKGVRYGLLTLVVLGFLVASVFLLFN